LGGIYGNEYFTFSDKQIRRSGVLLFNNQLTLLKEAIMMRKISLQNPCFILQLTILFSLSLNVLYCDASSIGYSVNSEDEIVGYASDLDMSFSAVSEEDMTKINLQFNGKVISV